MKVSALLSELRSQNFYRGQILRVREELGIQPDSVLSNDFAASVPRLNGGTLPQLLSVLGYDSVYRSLAAGLARAFADVEGSQDCEDALLCARVSASRELFWQLVALLEALDESRFSIVVCHNRRRAQFAFDQLKSTIGRADMGYAVEIGLIDDVADLSALEGRLPMITVMSTEGLWRFLRSRGFSQLRDVILSALGRVVLPGLDEWPPATACHAAFLFRELHIECLKRGVAPSLAGTAGPALGLEEFTSNLWGKPVRPASFVLRNTVEASPVAWINYGGCMVRDPRASAAWTREPLEHAANDLLKWLVGDPDSAKPKREGAIELHYLIDVSGSMSGGSIAAVQSAVIADLDYKLTNSILRNEDTLKLISFHTEVSTRLSCSVDENAATNFRNAVNALEIEGGTDITLGLGAALGQAVASEAGEIKILLLSDGYSFVPDDVKAQLLDLARRIRADGRVLQLLYVILDMNPPPEITNLIYELGGEVRRESVEGLAGSAGSDEWLNENAGLVGKYVVFLSGEHGLPESVTQPHHGGLRQLVFTRDTSTLRLDPKEVAAVVVSGRFGSLQQIESQVRHLGAKRLPVFILTPAEAWSQLLMENYPEADKLHPAPLAFPSNPHVARARLADAISDALVEWGAFRYLMEGQIQYDAFVDDLGTPPSKERTEKDFAMWRERFEYLAGGVAEPQRNAEVLSITLREGVETGHQDEPFATFTPDRVRLAGGGIKGFRDRAILPLVLYPGAVLDGPDSTAEVLKTTGQLVELTSRGLDLSVPILQEITITPPDSVTAGKEFSKVDRLGDIWSGGVRFECGVAGARRFSGGNLDDRFQDWKHDQPQRVEVETLGLLWKPESDPGNKVLVGLANLLRLAMVSVFRFADQTCIVVPDIGCGGIWIVELAPGGNGAALVLGRHLERFQDMLRVGGRIALDCPCQGGFAGSSDSSKAAEQDTGCPRCTRMVGPVIMSGQPQADLFAGGSKHDVLLWLEKHGFLPASGPKHLDEKYGSGIDISQRFHGKDDYSRREIRGVARRIFRDRLGLEIADEEVATFLWLGSDAASKGILGVYAPGSNELAVLKNLREWRAMDVYGHEFFHNLQHRLKGMMAPSLMSADVPMGGKLFIEGSAVWAESHFVDAVAIRTALILANLRQGDEYGEGFQIMKWIEENLGGVPAVLRFLSTGDIYAVSNGRIRDLAHLYNECGLTGIS